MSGMFYAMYCVEFVALCTFALMWLQKFAIDLLVSIVDYSPDDIVRMHDGPLRYKYISCHGD